MSSTSPPAISVSPPKRRKLKYAKALGYLLDPYLINEQAIKDGTAIEGQFGRTVATFENHLIRHCGIKRNDILTVRNPTPHMPPIHCVVVATNLSKRSRNPRTDVIEKAKVFLRTTEEPKWYFIVRE